MEKQNPDESLSEFVGSLAHEMRAPLFSIVGYTQLLLDYQARDEGTRRDCLTVILRQARQLTRIVDDMYVLSRLDAAAPIPLDVEPVDANDLIHDVLMRARDIADEKHIKLEMNVTAGLMPISADLGRLTQVLDNLVGNALKFSLQGGLVQVSAKPDVGGGAVRLSVRDGGIGIPPEAVSRVFERFYQVTDLPTQKIDGVGLGLYISRRLVEILGGEIGVNSVLCEGSEFWLTLPCHVVSHDGENRHYTGVAMPEIDA
jgi:signal transduction histidine kinase